VFNNIYSGPPCIIQIHIVFDILDMIERASYRVDKIQCSL